MNVWTVPPEKWVRIPGTGLNVYSYAEKSIQLSTGSDGQLIVFGASSGIGTLVVRKELA